MQTVHDPSSAARYLSQAARCLSPLSYLGAATSIGTDAIASILIAAGSHLPVRRGRQRGCGILRRSRRWY